MKQNWNNFILIHPAHAQLQLKRDPNHVLEKVSNLTTL